MKSMEMDLFYSEELSRLFEQLFFPAGVAKMNFFVFSVYTLLGTAVWSTILALAGYFLGSKWEIVSEYVNKYEKIIFAILIVVAAWYIARGIINIRKDFSKPKVKDSFQSSR